MAEVGFEVGVRDSARSAGVGSEKRVGGVESEAKGGLELLSLNIGGSGV